MSAPRGADLETPPDRTAKASAGEASTTFRPSTPASSPIHLRHKLLAVTYKTLCGIGKSPSRKDVLHRACLATEFRNCTMKPAEKGFFRHLNNHSAVPYPIVENLEHPWQKVFLLIQADLTGSSWPHNISAATRKELLQDRGLIHNLLDRVLRCLTDILGERADGRGVSVSLDVLRSVKAGVWEGNGMELLQIDGIGTAKMDRLRQAGVTNIKHLRRLDFFHIERLLSRNPPFGHQMLQQLSGFPILSLECEVVKRLGDVSLQTDSCMPTTSSTESGTDDMPLKPTWVAVLALGYENKDVPVWKKKHPCTTLAIEGEDSRLVWFWRGNVKRLANGKQLIVGLAASKGEKLKVTFACEEVVGTLAKVTMVAADTRTTPEQTANA